MPNQSAYPSHLPYRVLEGFVILLHAIGIGHVFFWANRIIKPNLRKLTPEERTLARFVYRNTIDLDQVWIDERAWLGPRQFKFAYVSLNLINSYGSMSPGHFIHELMHIWQYQHIGVAYIPRALHAQHFGSGYHYGGIEALLEALGRGDRILSFNYEQQAEIMTDYFALKAGLKPKYVPQDPELLSVFEQIVRPVITVTPRA